MEKTESTPNIPFNYLATPRNIFMMGIQYGPPVLIVSTFANPIPAAVAAITSAALKIISNLIVDILISSKNTSLKAKKTFLKFSKFISKVYYYPVQIIAYLIAATILGMPFSTTIFSLLAFLVINSVFSFILVIAIRIIATIILKALTYLMEKYPPSPQTGKIMVLLMTLIFPFSSQDTFKNYLKEKKEEISSSTKTSFKKHRKRRKNNYPSFVSAQNRYYS